MDFGAAQTGLLMKLLSASSLRARVIAGNISNQNVPGYKRQVVHFEDLLSERFAAGGAEAKTLEPKIETDFATPAGPDGNNVDMELESSAMRENRLLYELYASILQGRMEMLAASIREGR